MACGKAIVTIDNGDTGKLIKNFETGVLLKESEINDSHKVIIKLLHDDKLRKKIGENALMYADNNFNTWGQRMMDEIQAIQQILKEN